MLDLELTDPVITRERAEAEALAAEHEDLLVLLTTLRGASADALCALYFDGTVAARAGHRRLKRLVEHGLLARQQLSDRRSIYRLATGALSLSRRVRGRVSDAARKPLADDDANVAWLRSSLWAELKRRGYEVGRGADELLAVRRFLIDAQGKQVAAGGGASAARVLEALRADSTLRPLYRYRCTRCRWTGDLGVSASVCATCQAPTTPALAERRYQCSRCGLTSDLPTPHFLLRRVRTACNGTMRETDHLAFDVAWRSSKDTREVLLVFVDDPGRDLREQLRALPLRITGQPRLPIVLRTTDPASIFDRDKDRWTAVGDRHRALLRAFSDDGDARAFPFATTATVVDPCPRLQLRLSRVRRKEHAHA